MNTHVKTLLLHFFILAAGKSTLKGNLVLKNKAKCFRMTKFITFVNAMTRFILIIIKKSCTKSLLFTIKHTLVQLQEHFYYPF